MWEWWESQEQNLISGEFSVPWVLLSSPGNEGEAGGARRHQEGAVEARGSLGGGGKRGWVG